jgi:hypothetical protein
MITLERKGFAPADFKLTEAGAVTVAFAQLNVIDRDGDVTLPGAFPTKEVPMSAFGHTSWEGALPVGKGTVREAGGWGIFDGQFFLDTDQGRNAYATVKAMGPLQEWSYGYEVLDYAFGDWQGQSVRLLKRVDIYEVSPVLVGAGIGTHTVAIKQGLKGAIRPHHTDTSGAAWDANENVARLPQDRAALRAAHAWVDPEGDPDLKGSYKFPHHFVSESGEVGAASVVACSSAIGYLNREPGAPGYPDIPRGDRDGVYAHLAAHLRDAGRVPPELSELALDAGASLADALARFLGDGTVLGARLRAMADQRAKEGRVLSAANRERIASLRSALAAVMADLDALLAETEPPKARLAREAAALAELARFYGVPLL